MPGIALALRGRLEEEDGAGECRGSAGAMGTALFGPQLPEGVCQRQDLGPEPRKPAEFGPEWEPNLYVPDVNGDYCPDQVVFAVSRDPRRPPEATVALCLEYAEDLWNWTQSLHQIWQVFEQGVHMPGTTADDVLVGLVVRPTDLLSFVQLFHPPLLVSCLWCLPGTCHHVSAPLLPVRRTWEEADAALQTGNLRGAAKAYQITTARLQGMWDSRQAGVLGADGGRHGINRIRACLAILSLNAALVQFVIAEQERTRQNKRTGGGMSAVLSALASLSWVPSAVGFQLLYASLSRASPFFGDTDDHVACTRRVGEVCRQIGRADIW